jgi:hypothetical protein
MRTLQFLKDYKTKASKIANFWKLAEHDIPSKPGVYLLIAESVSFRHPVGKSRIYYIGQTNNLKRRLVGHLKWHTDARKKKRHSYSLLEPRHEYGGVYGGRYCFIPTWHGLSARSLEETVLARFARHYHTFPVANGAGAWRRIEKEFART